MRQIHDAERLSSMDANGLPEHYMHEATLPYYYNAPSTPLAAV